MLSRFARIEGLQMKVSNDGRRDVHQDRLTADLERADVPADQSADAEEAAAFATSGERRLEVADQYVFEVRQHAAGLQQATVCSENLSHQSNREVVQGQAGNDEIVDAITVEFFDRAMDDTDLIAKWKEAAVVLETQLQSFHELFIQLNTIELIAGLQPTEYGTSDRAGAGADFEDAARRPGAGERSGEGPGEESTAREKGAGIPEVPPRFAEEGAALGPEIHGGPPKHSRTRSRHKKHIGTTPASNAKESSESHFVRSRSGKVASAVAGGPIPAAREKIETIA
jgi:hypothetical protein